MGRRDRDRSRDYDRGRRDNRYDEDDDYGNDYSGYDPDDPFSAQSACTTYDADSEDEDDHSSSARNETPSKPVSASGGSGTVASGGPSTAANSTTSGGVKPGLLSSAASAAASARAALARASTPTSTASSGSAPASASSGAATPVAAPVSRNPLSSFLRGRKEETPQSSPGVGNGIGSGNSSGGTAPAKPASTINTSSAPAADTTPAETVVVTPPTDPRRSENDLTEYGIGGYGEDLAIPSSLSRSAKIGAAVALTAIFGGSGLLFSLIGDTPNTDQQLAMGGTGSALAENVDLAKTTEAVNPPSPGGSGLPPLSVDPFAGGPAPLPEMRSALPEPGSGNASTGKIGGVNEKTTDGKVDAKKSGENGKNEKNDTGKAASRMLDVTGDESTPDGGLEPLPTPGPLRSVGSGTPAYSDESDTLFPWNNDPFQTAASTGTDTGKTDGISLPSIPDPEPLMNQTTASIPESEPLHGVEATVGTEPETRTTGITGVVGGIPTMSDPLKDGTAGGRDPFFTKTSVPEKKELSIDPTEIGVLSSLEPPLPGDPLPPPTFAPEADFTIGETSGSGTTGAGTARNGTKTGTDTPNGRMGRETGAARGATGGWSTTAESAGVPTSVADPVDRFPLSGADSAVAPVAAEEPIVPPPPIGPAATTSSTIAPTFGSTTLPSAIATATGSSVPPATSVGGVTGTTGGAVANPDGTGTVAEMPPIRSGWGVPTHADSIPNTHSLSSPAPVTGGAPANSENLSPTTSGGTSGSTAGARSGGTGPGGAALSGAASGRTDTRTTSGSAVGTVPGSGGTGTTTYQLPKRQTVFDVARIQLGSASRWPEIYRLNKSVVSDPLREIPAGTQLQLPAR